MHAAAQQDGVRASVSRHTQRQDAPTPDRHHQAARLTAPPQTPIGRDQDACRCEAKQVLRVAQCRHGPVTPLRPWR